MSRFAVYVGALPAAIDRTASPPPSQEIEGQLREGEAALAADAGEEAATHFIAELSGAPVLTARPWPDAPPALAAGVAATWTGLPPGGTVRVVDVTAAPPVEVGSDVADGAGELSIAIDVAGPWRLLVDEDWPWLAGRFDVEVS